MSCFGFCRFALAAALLAPFLQAHPAIIINEFVAASSERRLSWNAEGVARVGSGPRWQEPGFDAQGWSNGLLPAGYAFVGLATDLTSTMKGKTPSLYLRKEFVPTNNEASSPIVLILSVQVNDGFVAYLNGREVARMNCGPTNHFVFMSEPACNVSTNTGVMDLTIGPASTWLSPGTNVLAIQAHNAEQPSTTNDPGRINSHLPTAEFQVSAGLRMAAGGGSPEKGGGAGGDELVPFGTNAGPWRYFVGRTEPSGGVVDMGLLTRTFTPPVGEEDDYDQPSAFSDWLELHNTGATAVDLAGWTLTDDSLVPAKWHFPTNTIIPGLGYLLILCDNREEANPPSGPASYLHTNFRLNDESGYVGLYDNAGQHVDGVPGGYPPQVSYCSYGRDPVNPANFVFLSTATPGTANRGVTSSGRAEPPAFLDALGTNFPGGLYLGRTPSLYFNTATTGAVIRYTLDGSEPTEGNGIAYTNPLVLTQSFDKTGVVVRARSFAPGLLPSKTRTHTYILKQPAALTNSPVLCFSGDPGRDLYRPDGLLAIQGGVYLQTSSGTIWSANGPWSYNWVLGNGAPSEREIHLEYYFPPGNYATNQSPLRTDIGLRVSASGYSRPRMKLTNPATTSPWPNNSVEKPSFNLYFNGDFGPGILDYGLYTNYPVREFEHLRLRAGKNDISNPFIVDELTRRLWIDMGHAGSRGLFCSLYANGIYRGVYNLCERFREQFFQAHHRSDLAWDVYYSGTWVNGNNTAFNQLLTALDLNLTNPANWQSVTNKLDIDNAADYYLLNIYCSMWDWPGNNYIVARERSPGPLSRFRFAVWDAEGAYAAITGAKPASYNTITNDLIVPSSSGYYNAALSRIFRRLATSPEFRLWFADHINARMFNGGVLDDRDPDGAGPKKCRFLQQLDTLVGEAGELVKYQSGQALKQSAFGAWISATSGRRSYLLGSTAGRQMFRQSGFWPLTEPPVFSQHGGDVAPGYSLTMTSYVATTGEVAAIFFTTNGVDPRRMGGAADPTARVFSDPVPINGVVTVKARARNTTTAEWSPLTEATFAPGVTPASSNNLVIAEIMYHPPAPTATEEAARYDNADDFEFARLMNIGDGPIDLAGVRFADGVTFDLTTSPLRYLTPGQSILVAANLGAFQMRYGHGLDPMIGGIYAGNLANSGERLLLLDTNNAVIRDFAYDDVLPWPFTPDGGGPSLVLLNAAANPDHADPFNWAPSAVPGGMPSGSPTAQTYATWRGLFWNPVNATNNAVSGPSTDADGDGISNFLEYTLGLDPTWWSETPAMSVTTAGSEDDLRLVIGIRRATGATNATLTWEWSNDLQTWATASGVLQIFDTTPYPDGTTLLRYMETTPLSASTTRFFRVRISGP